MIGDGEPLGVGDFPQRWGDIPQSSCFALWLISNVVLKAKIGDLSESTKGDGEMIQLVSEGKKPMPSFGKKLSKEEMAAVVHYAKGLAKGAK